jgi:hypothetical protein
MVPECLIASLYPILSQFDPLRKGTQYSSSVCLNKLFPKCLKRLYRSIFHN